MFFKGLEPKIYLTLSQISKLHKVSNCVTQEHNMIFHQVHTGCCIKHVKIRHYKKDNVNPTIKYFIYEFHSNKNTCPTETGNLYLLSSCLARKNLQMQKRWFIWIDMRVQLHPRLPKLLTSGILGWLKWWQWQAPVAKL
jgi:hypothetical protein